MEETLKQAIAKAASQVLGKDIAQESFLLEHPADEHFGDWATNVAMVNSAGGNPREIAQKIADAISSNLPDGLLHGIEVAGPGFVNIKIEEQLFWNELASVKEDFGLHRIGAGQRVMIEFGQPNTHKAFHVGHLKSAITGLSLVGIYEAMGFEVIKVNFYSDIGMHVAKCTWGAMQQPDEFKTIADLPVHERMKRVDAFYSEGAKAFEEEPEAEAAIREINKKIYAGEEGLGLTTYLQLREWSLEHLDGAFESLGVVYDRQYPESETGERAVEIVNANMDKVFTKSDGAIIFDGSKVGLTSWVFITKEGLPTYEAKDLALAQMKFEEFNPDLSLITTSVEQRDRFDAVIYCLGQIDQRFKDRYKHLPFGWLLRGGKKFSSRQGGSIKGMDVIGEAVELARSLILDNKEYTKKEVDEIAFKVGVGGLKFLILSHEFHKDIHYDPDSFISLDGYSGPFIMYAYARAASIVRSAENSLQEEMISPATNTEKSEVALLKYLARYPEYTKAAYTLTAPHMLCNYLFELSQRFNKFYDDCPVLKAEEEKVRARRLRLTGATAHVLKSGLKILGIDTVEQM